MKENTGNGLGQLIAQIDRRRKETPVAELLFLAASTVYVGVCLFFAATTFEASARYGILFLGLSVVVTGVASLKGKPLYPVSKKWNRMIVVVFCAVAMAVTWYFYSQYLALHSVRAGIKSTLDYAMGILALVMILEATRKCMGLLMPGVVVILWLYAYFGEYFPGLLEHRGLSLLRISAISGAEPDSIFGNLTALSATVIAIFVFYTSFIRGCGAMDLIYRAARFLVQKSGRLLYQVPVVTSLLFGTCSGSGLANAAAVGSITIPLMKTYGVPPSFAAAVESVSSTGGAIMPPILGAAAFVMMDYLSVSYLVIMLAAIPGALIFYSCVALGTDIKCRRWTLSLPPSLTPQAGANATPGTGTPLTPFQKSSSVSIYKVIPILISMSALVFSLAYLQLDALPVGFYAIASFLASELVIDLVLAKGRPSGIVAFVNGVINGIKDGASAMAPMAILFACMSIIMKILVATALTQKLSFLMVDLSGGHLSVLLLMVGVIAILFGMVMSGLACYILVVMLAAPALITFGVVPIAAHFTVFYLSILAVLTPPVASVCLVTSQIAKANYLQTCWESIKLGAVIFIMPFVFIFQPALLTTNLNETPRAFLLTLVAMLSVTAGLASAWTLTGILKGIVYLAMGVLILTFPDSFLTVAAMALVVAMLTFEMIPLLRTRLVGFVRNGARSRSP